MVWARIQKTSTPEQWTKVMLNGEKKFELFENMLRQQVRRRRGKKHKVDCFINCEAWRRISTNLKHYYIQQGSSICTTSSISYTNATRHRPHDCDKIAMPRASESYEKIIMHNTDLYLMQETQSFGRLWRLYLKRMINVRSRVRLLYCVIFITN